MSNTGSQRRYVAKTVAPSNDGSQRTPYASSQAGASDFSASTSVSRQTSLPVNVVDWMFPPGQTRNFNGVQVESLHVEPQSPVDDPNHPGRAPPEKVRYLGHTADDTMSLMGVEVANGDKTQLHFYCRPAETGTKAAYAGSSGTAQTSQRSILSPIPARQDPRVERWADEVATNLGSQRSQVSKGVDDLGGSVRSRNSGSQVTLGTATGQKKPRLLPISEGVR